VLNGAGEVSGLTQLMEWGLVETPIFLTNTLSVGAVSDAAVQWMIEQFPASATSTTSHPAGGGMRRLLAERRRRPPRQAGEHSRGPGDGEQRTGGEGSVGGGTGMICSDFKAASAPRRASSAPRWAGTR